MKEKGSRDVQARSVKSWFPQRLVEREEQKRCTYAACGELMVAAAKMESWKEIVRVHADDE